VESGENEVWLSSRMQGQQGCAQASMTLWAMRTKAAHLHWSTEQFETYC
jgi:hypothetical protein